MNSSSLFPLSFPGGASPKSPGPGRGGTRPEPVPGDVLRDQIPERRFHHSRCDGQTATGEFCFLFLSVSLSILSRFRSDGTVCAEFVINFLLFFRGDQGGKRWRMTLDPWVFRRRVGNFLWHCFSPDFFAAGTFKRRTTKSLHRIVPKVILFSSQRAPIRKKAR